MIDVYKFKTADGGQLSIRRCSGSWNVYYDPEELPKYFIASFKSKRDAKKEANLLWYESRDLNRLSY